jgi:hypothetical protein
MGRRSGASVEPVGLRACPDPDGANFSRSFVESHQAQHHWSATARDCASESAGAQCSRAARIPAVAARSAYETAMRPQTLKRDDWEGMTLDALES